MKIALALPQKPAPDSLRPVWPELKGLREQRPDLVLFPEQFLYLDEYDNAARMQELTERLGATCLVGCFAPADWAEKGSPGYPELLPGQFLIPFDPGKDVYRDSEYLFFKHTCKGSPYVGWIENYYFDHPVDQNVAPAKIAGQPVGASICHDLFLGGIFHAQKRLGARVLLNATHYKVQDAKWGRLARLRALENGLPVLITVHVDGDGTAHHPFAFDADGQEMTGIRAGDGARLAASQMHGAGEAFVFEMDGAKPRPRRRALEALPPAGKSSGENKRRRDSLRVKMQGGRLVPATVRSDLDIIAVPGMELLDFRKCFEGLRRSEREGRKSILWNDWGATPPPVEQWMHVMLGRSLEFSVPVLLSAGGRILELTERASDHKQIRRCTIGGEAAWVELHWADALRRSFNITCSDYAEQADRVQGFEDFLALYEQMVEGRGKAPRIPSVIEARGEAW